MRLRYPKTQFTFLRSTEAFAVPITYLILFVSLTAIVSLTYTFAVTKINAQGALLKASVARQNMLILDDAIRRVAWSFDASEIVYVDECGGTFETTCAARRLVLSIGDGNQLNTIVFNSSIGEVSYGLNPSQFGDYGTYVRGDDRAIINRSSSSMTQLYIANRNSTQNIVLCYRPRATAAITGVSDGKTSNLIRINIINLNSSQNLALKERFYLKATSINVAVQTWQFEFNSTVTSLFVKAILDRASDTVRLPISSTINGAIVDLEVVVCNIKLQRTEA